MLRQKKKHFTRLPFGLKKSATIFQRLIASVEKDLIEQELSRLFTDDIGVITTTQEKTVEIIRELLKRFAERNIIVNKEKCDLLKPEVEYVGYRLSANGIHPNKNLKKFISEIKTPTNKTEVQKVIQILQYLSKFIPNLAKQMRRRINLLRKKKGRV